MQRRGLLTAVPALALAALGEPVRAQNKPIRLIVPYPPGGPLDIVARALAEKTHDTLGPVIVDNRPGAGLGQPRRRPGRESRARRHDDRDGRGRHHAINPWLFKKMPYDALHDFTPPITGVAQVPNVLVMNTANADKLGIRTLADLVTIREEEPGQAELRLRRQRQRLATSRARCSSRRPASSWSTFRTPAATRRSSR